MTKQQFQEPSATGVPADSYAIERLSNRSFSRESDSAKFCQRKNSAGLQRLNKLGKKDDAFAHGIREHVSLSPKISQTLKAKLSWGARVLRVGGMEKVFKRFFKVGQEDRLLKALQCYLSTTAGPLAGLLFISTQHIAFCSERSLKLSCPNGDTLRVHYKVLIPLAKIDICNQSEDIKRPSQKYIEIVTVDSFDFWFMGFLNHQKTWRYLQQAILQVKLN